LSQTVARFGVLKCSSPVGVSMSDDESSQVMDGNVPVYASAMVFLGVWGLVLAALNMFSMAHPTYHVSWGGLLTFEATNAAFGEAKDGFHFEVLGDTVFIAGCLGLIAFGARTVNERHSMADWAKGLLINDTWPALNDPGLGGGQRTLAAWCMVLGLAFYLYFGISHSGWIDVGVYSVFIALMASGIALNHASRVPPGDDKID
jgi:hypothetical protein